MLSIKRISMKYLKGFDYASYCKRHKLSGQVDPWRKTDTDKPIYALLVPVEMALEECKGWSGQDITRHEFLQYLKLNDTLAFKNIDEFAKFRDDREEERKAQPKPKKHKRELTEEQRETRRIQMKEINESKKASILWNTR